jgi:hypothetical protein
LPITSEPPHAPGPLVDLRTVREHFRAADMTHNFDALWTAVADIPVLLAEIDRVNSLFFLARILHANLAAAGYATIAADRDGEDDPLWYLRDELRTIGKIPPRWLSAHDLLSSPDLPGREGASR